MGHGVWVPAFASLARGRPACANFFTAAFAGMTGVAILSQARMRGSCSTNNVERDNDSKIRHPALALVRVPKKLAPRRQRIVTPPRLVVAPARLAPARRVKPCRRRSRLARR